MPLKMTCPHCAVTLLLPLHLSGATEFCPSCHKAVDVNGDEVVRIPVPPAVAAPSPAAARH